MGETVHWGKAEGTSRKLTRTATRTHIARSLRGKPETRNQKPETRNKKPEKANQKTRSPKLERASSGFWFLVSGFWFLVCFWFALPRRRPNIELHRHHVLHRHEDVVRHADAE